MLRKIFAAVIVCVFMLSLQIVHAEEEAFDWNSAPHFASKAEVAAYIENGRRQGQTAFYFVLTSVTINADKEKGLKEILALNEDFVNTIALVPVGNLSAEFGTGNFF